MPLTRKKSLKHPMLSHRKLVRQRVPFSLRRLVVPVILSFIVGTGLLPPAEASVRHDTGTNHVMPPAKVLGRVSLAPAAGNGLFPQDFALDSIHHRLYVLNSGTRNISVIDTQKHLLIATIPLPPSTRDDEIGVIPGIGIVVDGGLGNLYILDPSQKTSRIFVYSTASFRSTRTVRIEGIIEESALSDRRHELFISSDSLKGNSQIIRILDTRTLVVRGAIPVESRVLSLTIADQQNVLVGLTTTQPFDERHVPPPGQTDRHGREPPLEVLSWGLDTHHLSGRSALFHSEDEEGSSCVYVDPIKGHVTVLVTTTPAVPGFRRNLAGQTLRTMQLPDLHVLSDQAVSVQLPELLTDESLLDSNRVLITYLTRMGFQSGLVSTSTTGAKMTPLVESEWSHLPRFDPNIREPIHHMMIGSVSNQIICLDDRTLKAAWSISSGADIHRILLNRRDHTILSVVETDLPRYVWMDSKKVGLRASGPAGQTMLTLDGKTRASYYSVWLGKPAAAAVLRIAADGSRINFPSPRGSPFSMALMDSPNSFYLAVQETVGGYPGGGTAAIPAHLPQTRADTNLPVNDLAEVDASTRPWWLETYVDGKLIHETKMLNPPNRLLYAPGANRLYLVYPTHLAAVGGRSFDLPFKRSDSALPDDATALPLVDSGRTDDAQPVDVDLPGLWAYCADPETHVLYKIRLSDGKVLALRKLSFSPSALAVDSAAHHIHLVDWINGAVVTVETF